jgi:glycine cleavage system regulatory protein
MKTSIVLTIIADDKPGVIKTVSKTLRRHGGSWSQSSMSSLSGQFAGILLASVPVDKAQGCLQELHGLKSSGIRVTGHVSEALPRTKKTHEYSLDLVGNNRKGIVHDITAILANHEINVHNLETVVESASMGGGELFKATAQLIVPTNTDIDMLESELEDMANELMVDFRLEK